ncbi:UTP--glucose-1-phosphate uridylyltransferase GalU [Methylophilaceae bacterium]|jgi:UTP--glucose-1-phosphate uridylyltransferase|nr:UTP--glucose-1-phosphate uridylyltransferase GalU [Methylophilaceae bacterium]|tara:strand:+ start:943 stop:1812 length:870 start_codon:yes stop_codon:yes gene_type:complete
MKLNKVVFPVAGLGSRFFPATKATPKEMLPIVDKPLIQYAVEEALDAGFTELIFVTAKSKTSIRDHFESKLNTELSNLTKEKKELLSKMNKIIPNGVSCKYVFQEEPLGLGHAILQAKQLINDEPFAVILADDLIDSKIGALKQMVDLYNDTNSSIISVQKVDKASSVQYGMVSIDEGSQNTMKLNDIIEKPLPENAPSNLGVVGRYIFCNEILKFLENISFGTGNEIQLTDGIKSMLIAHPVYAYEFEGTRYDCGDKLGFIKANIEYALKNKIFGDDLEGYLKNRLKI